MRSTAMRHCCIVLLVLGLGISGCGNGGGSPSDPGGNLELVVGPFYEPDGTTPAAGRPMAARASSVTARWASSMERCDAATSSPAVTR